MVSINVPSQPVLIVDPNAEARAVAVEYLKKIGVAVAETDGNAQAIALVAQAVPKLVLLEVTLNDGPALGLLQHLRQDPQLAMLRVIIVTREVRPPVVAPFIRLGISDLIIKPYTATEYYSKINKSLSLWSGKVPEELQGENVPWSAAALEQVSVEGSTPVASSTSDAAGEEVGKLAYMTLPSEQKKDDSTTETRADILLIDDMPNVAKRFGDLMPRGIVVESCVSSEEAVTLARSKTYKVVLIDMQIPNVDSGMLLRQISLFQTGSTFVAMGLKTVSTLNEDARALGFDGVLTKPFEHSKVADLIDRYFENKDKIVVEENLVTIASSPGSADRQAAFYYRLANELPGRLEAVADACYPEVIINAPELRGSRKSVVEVLVKLKEAADNLGLELLLVVPQEVVAYSKEFVETRNLKMFNTVEDARLSLERAGEF
ncbi:MAG: response regulator [Pseudomonadota bacterium]